jgi:hypothetical protein
MTDKFKGTGVWYNVELNREAADENDAGTAASKATLDKTTASAKRESPKQSQPKRKVAVTTKK